MSRSATPPQPPPLFPPRPNTHTPPQPLLPNQSLDSLGRDKARLDDKEMSLPAHKALKGISQGNIKVSSYVSNKQTRSKTSADNRQHTTGTDS